MTKETRSACVVEIGDSNLGEHLTRRLQDVAAPVRRFGSADLERAGRWIADREAEDGEVAAFLLVGRDPDASVLRPLTTMLELVARDGVSVVVGLEGVGGARAACDAVLDAFEQGGLRCRRLTLPADAEAACEALLNLPAQINGPTVATAVPDRVRWSISAVIGCYNENPAIPTMYERLKAVFTKLDVDHEIIFINNDNRPGTDAEELILDLSHRDPCVVGINMSRNFQSQAGFVSGLQLSTKNACVLLDGDLQDPPELIEQFVEKWKEGYQVVYGRRVKREATPFMQFAFKAFYRLWDALSYITVPRDAGDFSLIDRTAVEAILSCQERDLWLRGLRAFVGFRQTGVDYVRPERPWGKTSNNMLRNLHWARKGIFSFSNTPLTILTYTGFVLVVLSVLFLIEQVLWNGTHPRAAPWGFTTLITAILFFGSVNLFACGILGEYIGRIFEEAKQRPLYVLRSITRFGTSHLVAADENVPIQRQSIRRVPSLLPAIRARESDRIGDRESVRFGDHESEGLSERLNLPIHQSESEIR